MYSCIPGGGGRERTGWGFLNEKEQERACSDLINHRERTVRPAAFKRFLLNSRVRPSDPYYRL
jgi:hypothetical protein